MPSEFQFKEPPLALGIPRSRPWYGTDIFWNRPILQSLLERHYFSFFISALNYAFDSGCLSVTERQGVIKLIPKKDAELHFIKNWRPITLLNTDYKISAKSIANQIKLVLPNLINHDQT